MLTVLLALALVSAATAQSPCSGTVTAAVSVGQPYSLSDGTGNYASNSNCIWRISSSGTSLLVNFSAVATESNYDFVRVYRGSEVNAANFVRMFTGSQAATNFEVPSSSVVIQFTSDGSVNQAGFTATVSSTATLAPTAPPVVTPPVSQPTNTGRPKILCLHGGGQTASSFSQMSGMAALVNQFNPSFEFVFASGPYSGNLWIRDPPLGKSSPTTDANWASQSVTLLNSMVQNQGPFVGILGFSQGTAMTTYYLSQVPAGTFQFAILYTFYLPETHLGLMSSINAASPFGGITVLGFMGQQDSVISNAQSDAAALKFSSPVRVTSSTAGHHPPYTSDPAYNNVAAFLSARTGTTTTTTTTSQPIAQPTNSGTGCANTGVISVSTVVTITDGPGSYPNNANCVWTLTGASPITISFSSFGMENQYDFVKVYSGTGAIGANLIRSFTGPSASSVTVTSTTVTVVLTSDNSVNGAGFVATASSGTATTSAPLAVSTFAPISATPIGGSSPSSPGQSTPCSGTQSLAVSGTPITISDGPGPYANNANCVWALSSSCSSITITFATFATENGYDFMKVYSGTAAYASALQQTRSGSTRDAITVLGNNAVIAFSSDASVNQAGFEATVSATGCATTPTPVAPSAFISCGQCGTLYTVSAIPDWGRRIMGNSVNANSYTSSSSALESFGRFCGYFGLNNGVFVTTGRAASMNVPYSEVGSNGEDLGAVGTVGDDIALTITFTAQIAGTASLRYVFASQEMPKYFNTNYNDDVSITLNGANIARVPNGQALSINAIGPTGVKDPSGWISEFVQNTGQGGCSSAPPSMSGHVQLTASGPVRAGTNTLVVRVTDRSDGRYNSAIFMAENSFTISYNSFTPSPIAPVPSTPVPRAVPTNSPTPRQCVGTTTLVVTSGQPLTISNGAPTYATNMVCSWRLSASSGSLNIFFTSFDTEAQFDTVKVYGGGTASTSSLIRELSGSNLATSLRTIEVGGPQAVVNFVSDSSVQGIGWTARVTSTSATGMTARATFSMNGVSGSISFSQATPTSSTAVNVALNGLANRAGGYHVHADPIDYRQASVCSASSVGGHWNPVGVTGTCVPSNPIYSCEVGDLSGKHGSMNGVSDFIRSYIDSNLPLSGSSSIVGRSIVIHESSGARWVCANIVGTGGGAAPSPATLSPGPVGPTATANFNMGGVSGSIVFSQATSRRQGSSGPTSVSISLTGLVNKAGPYHVHVNPLNTQQYGIVPASVCSAGSVGGHFNPAGVTGTCIPSRPETCEIGDLSGKHGLLSGFDFSQSYTDSNLPLSGANSIVGRSIVIHENNGARWVCADIIATGGGAAAAPPVAPPCSGTTTLRVTSQPITITDGPNQYSPNLECSWSLLGPPGWFILLNFTSFSVEDNYDLVSIYTGALPSTTGFIRSNAGTVPFSQVVPSNNAYVRFESDASQQSSGFIATISAVRPTAGTGATGYPTFSPSQAPFVRSGCSGTVGLTVSAAPVRISDGVGDYHENMVCSWALSGLGQSINITFTRMVLEANYDFVKVYRGLTADSANLVTSLTDSQARETKVVVDYGFALVVFTTDSSANAAGFDAIALSPLYNPGARTLPPTLSPRENLCSGTITRAVSSAPVRITDGSGYYANSMHCGWVLNGAGASITITFQNFRLESNYDFVRVYTGNAATSSNLFRTYTGLVVPDRLLVPSNTVLIDFVSDSSATQEGFLLTAVSITSLVPTVSPITQSSTVNSGSSSIVDYVAAHNLNRTNNGLSAMVYNKNLEDFAKTWASTLASRNCALEHSTFAQRSSISYPGGTGAGENIFWSSGTPTWFDAVASWWSEISNYRYGPSGQSCTQSPTGSVVGHFTQIAWQCSVHVGCAFNTCGNSNIMVCNYGVAGNLVGDLPFSSAVAGRLGLSPTPCASFGRLQQC